MVMQLTLRVCLQTPYFTVRLIGRLVNAPLTLYLSLVAQLSAIGVREASYILHGYIESEVCVVIEPKHYRDEQHILK